MKIEESQNLREIREAEIQVQMDRMAAEEHLRAIRELYRQGYSEDEVKEKFRNDRRAQNCRKAARQVHDYRNQIHKDYYGLPWYGGMW